MAEEPTVRESNGNSIPLRDFVERVFEERWRSHLREHELEAAAYRTAEALHRSAHDREHGMTGIAINKAEEAINRALNAAKDANDKRFESVNEFRATLADASTRFATREIVTGLEKSLIERAERSENETSRRLAELERSNSMNTGRGAGIAMSWAAIVAGAGLIAVIVGLLAKFF